MHGPTWLLLAVLLTWPTVDPRFTIELQRRIASEVATVYTGIGDTLVSTLQARERTCWRWRYTHPQESGWSQWTCLRVRP